MMILGVLVILSVDKTHLLDRHLTIQAARAFTRAKRIKERKNETNSLYSTVKFIAP